MSRAVVHHESMFTKVMGGLVLAVLVVGLIWQQRSLRRMHTDLVELAQQEHQPVHTPVASGAATHLATCTAAQAEVRALQVRVVGLEARVQELTLALQSEFQRQREADANNLTAGPVSARELQEQILDTKRSLKERFNTFRALLRQGLADAHTTTAFLNEVMAQHDDELTAPLFKALDNTGNFAAAPTLIKGLESEKAELRMLALDALSEMQSDATVVQWLQHVARNDPQERVRLEAVRVLAQAGNQP